MNINEVTTFLGWCSVINFFIYALSAVFILVFKNFTARSEEHTRAQLPV